jgi:HAD superfamily hydrolase (TIGR01549 family)
MTDAAMDRMFVRIPPPCEYRPGPPEAPAIAGEQPPRRLMCMPFRAILFDIGDTLWHSRGAPPPGEFRRLAAGRAAAAIDRLGISHPDPALVARTTWNAMEAAMHDARATNLIEPDYGAVSQAALHGLGLDVSRDQAAELLEATYISGIEGGKAPFDDARATLLELRRRGFLLGTVTNRAFGGERFRADIRAAGLDIGWDVEAVSIEVGYLKPHPSIFLYALEQLDVAPSETLMVGNSLAEDIAGAQRLGMSAAWRRSLPDAEAVTPDFAFDELCALLDFPELQEPG